jgi:hypothetical protein
MPTVPDALLDTLVPIRNLPLNLPVQLASTRPAQVLVPAFLAQLVITALNLVVCIEPPLSALPANSVLATRQVAQHAPLVTTVPAHTRPLGSANGV